MKIMASDIVFAALLLILTATSLLMCLKACMIEAITRRNITTRTMVVVDDVLPIYSIQIDDYPPVYSP